MCSYHGATSQSTCLSIIFHEDVDPRNKNRRNSSRKASAKVGNDYAFVS